MEISKNKNKLCKKDRAAIWHVDYVSKGTKKVDAGQRVDGQFLNQYGGDIYAGATIEIYISKDIPELM